MQTIDLQRKHDLTAQEVEIWRELMGGRFGVRWARQKKKVRDFRKKFLRVEPISDWEYVHNIVTNQGLNALLDIMFHGDTQITTWYLELSKTNTTPLSTHTYASPGFTAATTTNLDEATRPAYVEAAASGQSMTNTASVAVFTGDDTFTAYGCALVGGGWTPTTIADAAGGGKMYSSALFSSSKAMAVDVVLQVTYVFTAADDGV